MFVNVENQNLYKPSSCHEPAQEILKNGKHWYLYFVDVSADKHIDKSSRRGRSANHRRAESFTVSF